MSQPMQQMGSPGRQDFVGALTSDAAAHNVMLNNQNVANIILAPQNQGATSQRGGNSVGAGQQFAPGSVKN